MYGPTRMKAIHNTSSMLFINISFSSDLTILKCFQSACRPDGHYHCPLCKTLILKRNAFVTHMLSHAKKEVMFYLQFFIESYFKHLLGKKRLVHCTPINILSPLQSCRSHFINNKYISKFIL